MEKIQFMEKIIYGLTTFDLRRIAFQFAEGLGTQHRFSRDSKMAGKEWLNAFLKRHPGLAIRKPEPTSLSRAVGFNRPQVGRFPFTESCWISTVTARSRCGMWMRQECQLSKSRPT